MKKSAVTDSKNIINVIDDFDSTASASAYKSNFKKWRKNKDNPFAFNFEINKKESVFSDSRGFENRSKTEAEKKVLGNIMRAAGIAMLISIVFFTVVNKLVIYLLECLGFDIHTTFFSPSVYGSGKEIVIVMIAVSFAALFIPAVYLHKRFKMPVNVGVMRTVNDSAEIIGSIGAALIVCTISCLPSAYSSDSRDIYNYFQSIETDVSVWGQTEFVFYTIFDIIILSFITEFFLRGAIFSALRQFGDVIAIVITTVMSALLTRNFLEIPSAILISLVASIGMLRSGTIFSALMVRVVFKMYQLALIIIEANADSQVFLQRNLFMVVVFLAGIAITAAVMFTGGRKNKRYLVKYHSELSLRKQLRHAVGTFPFSAVAGLCLLEALIKIGS
jgi:hypothetical protein rflaF_18951